MIKFLSAFLLLTLLSLNAEENDLYFGLGASKVRFDHQDRFDEYQQYKTNVYSAYAGGIMNDYFTAEIQYVTFADIDSERETKNYRTSFSSYNVGVSALYPISEDHLSIYGRFAVGELLFEEVVDGLGSSATTATVIVGGGLLIKPIKNLGFRLFYERYSFDLIDLAGSEDDKSDDTLYQMLLENIGLSIEVRF